VTVFAGNPERYPQPQRTWDVQSGFGPDDDVMEARRHEDRAALAMLGRRAGAPDFVEHSYLPGTNRGSRTVARRPRRGA